MKTRCRRRVGIVRFVCLFIFFIFDFFPPRNTKDVEGFGGNVFFGVCQCAFEVIGLALNNIV